MGSLDTGPRGDSAVPVVTLEAVIALIGILVFTLVFIGGMLIFIRWGKDVQ